MSSPDKKQTAVSHGGESLFDDDGDNTSSQLQQQNSAAEQKQKHHVAADNKTTTRSSALLLPPEASDLARNMYAANSHFREFVKRQVDNRKEYAFNDTQRQFIASAAERDEEDPATGQLPSVVKVPGKVTHLVFRSSHWYWFDLARHDFTNRKDRAASQRYSPVAIAVFVVALTLVMWVRWPLWDFLVAIQANEHYRVLGLEPGATITEINRAYRELTRKVHPDRNPGCGQKCVTMMMEVKKAYEVLKGKDEASELQNQIDQMFGQIVMFTFGDVFAMAIQCGVVCSALLNKLFLGSLDEEGEEEVNNAEDDTKSPSTKKVALKTFVSSVDFLLRGFLLMTGIGLVIFTSDRNPVSLIAIVYALVQHVSLNNSSESVAEVFRYRGLQMRDMVVSLAVFMLPSLLADVGPSLATYFLASSSSETEGGGGGSSFDFATSASSSSLITSIVTATLGVSYVVSSIFTAPPSFFDNQTMCRAVAPIDMVAGIDQQQEDAGGGSSSSTRLFTTTKWSTTKFILFTILKRDVLAFGLKIPAAYRIAAFAVYGAVFAQMLWYPTEAPIFFDSRFRQAEDAAKRRATMKKQQQQQNTSSSSSSSASSRGLKSPSSTIPPPVEMGKFDFATNDIEQPKFHVLKMNETERQVCSQLDNEVPIWQELFRFDDNTTCRPQEVANKEHFDGILTEIMRRDCGATMQRQYHKIKLTPLFQNLVPKNDPHALEFYGNHRVRETAKLVQSRVDGLLMGGGGGGDVDSRGSNNDNNNEHGANFFSTFTSSIGFWLMIGSVVVALSLSSHIPAAQVAAGKLFPSQHAAASAMDLKEKMEASFSYFDCDDSSFRSSLKNQRRVRGTQAKVCRTILAQDTYTKASTTHTVNIFSQLEGYNPLKVVSDADIRRRYDEIVLRGSSSSGNTKNSQQQQRRQQQRGGSGKKQQQRYNPRTGGDEYFDYPSGESFDGSSSGGSRGPSSSSDPQDFAAFSANFHKRASHDLTQKRRQEQQELQKQQGGGGGGAGDVPFFGGGDGSDSPGQPTQEELEEFLKFAQKLEARQRQRGWRPKPEYDPAYFAKKQRQAAEQARTATRNAKRLSGGSGSSSSSVATSSAAEEQARVAEEAEQRMMEAQAAQARTVQTMQQYQRKMFIKMQSWIEDEVKAGRLHLDWKGKVVEKDTDSLVEWMMENDETWEPDPDIMARRSQQEKLGGPAAEELRRLRGGGAGGAGAARRKKRK